MKRWELISFNKAPCLLAERKFSKMVDREFSLKFLFKSILHRLGESGHSPDPQKNPITAICCAPGGGKTRFIDEVASLFSMTDKRNEAFKSAEVVKEVDSLNKIFDGLVPISITYNAGSIYCDDYDDAFAPKNPPAGFALRVLFKYVCCTPNTAHSVAPTLNKERSMCFVKNGNSLYK